jgi:hypothetical protein
MTSVWLRNGFATRKDRPWALSRPKTSVWIRRPSDGKADHKIVPPRLRTPYKGLSADSEEKHEPFSDIDTAVAESLKSA